MSLCKFTLGVAAGIAGVLLYDAVKKGKISCCFEHCDSEAEGLMEKGKKAVHDVAEKASAKVEEVRHGFDRQVAEPIGDLANK